LESNRYTSAITENFSNEVCNLGDPAGQEKNNRKIHENGDMNYIGRHVSQKYWVYFELYMLVLNLGILGAPKCMHNDSYQNWKTGIDKEKKSLYLLKILGT